MRVLFVCHGNVGRSQMAEGFYNHYTGSEQASSAGTDPTTPARYDHPTKEIISAMKEEGIDVSKKKIKTISPEILSGVDVAYVICDKTQCPDFLLYSDKAVFWDIEDPFQMDLEGTIEIRNQIKQKVLNLL
jgi:arsenate reductase